MIKHVKSKTREILDVDKKEAMANFSTAARAEAVGGHIRTSYIDDTYERIARPRSGLPREAPGPRPAEPERGGRSYEEIHYVE